MKLDVNGQHYNVASAATGNAALGFGIAGTALGLMGNNRCGNGGILGGLFGGNNCGCNDCYVTEREQNLAIALAQAQSKEQALQLAREEDAKIADVLKQTNAGLIEVANGVSRNDVRLSCLEEKVTWIREESARNLREAKEFAEHLVECERKERQSADQNVLAYTNAELAKKIDGTLKLDSDMISYGQCRAVVESCPCGTPSNPINVKMAAEAAAQAVMAALNK